MEEVEQRTSLLGVGADLAQHDIQARFRVHGVRISLAPRWRSALPVLARISRNVSRPATKQRRDVDPVMRSMAKARQHLRCAGRRRRRVGSRRTSRALRVVFEQAAQDAPTLDMYAQTQLHELFVILCLL